MTKDYTVLFSSLTDTVEKFIAGVNSKKLTAMTTDEWSVKDQLCHITFWHENYAVNYEALANKKDPLLPEGMSTINMAGVLSLKKYSTKKLIERLRKANKSLYKSIVIKKVPRMTYSRGGRVYETQDFLEMVIGHINTHLKLVKKVK